MRRALQFFHEGSREVFRCRQMYRHLKTAQYFREKSSVRGRQNRKCIYFLFSVHILYSNLIIGNFSYLIEICNVRNLVPKIAHYHRIAGKTKTNISLKSEDDTYLLIKVKFKPLLIPFASSLKYREFDSKTVKIIFVKVSIIVEVVHIPHQKLDSVVPAINSSHLKTSG